MGEVQDTFGQILNDIQSATGASAVRMGRMARGGTYEGKAYGPLSGVPGAALLLTLDKQDFANMTGRMRRYERIPYYTGTVVFHKIGKYLTGSGEYAGKGPIYRAFRTESEPGGTKWQKLSKTQERMRGAKGPILDDTGELKAAATNERQMIQQNVTGQYARLLFSPEHLEGTTRFKFFVHQLGSDNGWGMGIHIPARPFFPTGPGDLTSQETNDITNITFEGIREGVEEDKAQRALRRG